jgi:hypothetical protein
MKKVSQMKAKGINTTQKRDCDNCVWLKAVYHFHIFHYRMPETAAIAAVTPFVPSPLTVKMAIVASLFQMGDIEGVYCLSEHLNKIEVKMIPPKAELFFKAFMRYRSPPAVESEKGLDSTGSYYPSRPHIREYAIFQDCLSVYVKVPKDIKDYAARALKNIRYLGCKDSIVTCIEIAEGTPEENKCVSTLTIQNSGVAVFLADFKPDVSIGGIKQLIPGNRDENIYERRAYILPGKLFTKGKSRLFVRK